MSEASFFWAAGSSLLTVALTATRSKDKRYTRARHWGCLSHKLKGARKPVIGLCPPFTRAAPRGGVLPAWWVGGARWPSSPYPLARRAWIPPGWRVRCASMVLQVFMKWVDLMICKGTLRQTGEGLSVTQVPPLHNDLKQYARAPHPPTRRDSSPPDRWVRCTRPAHPTHPPGRQATPCRGVLPVYTVGRDQFL